MERSEPVKVNEVAALRLILLRARDSEGEFCHRTRHLQSRHGTDALPSPPLVKRENL